MIDFYYPTKFIYRAVHRVNVTNWQFAVVIYFAGVDKHRHTDDGWRLETQKSFQKLSHLQNQTANCTGPLNQRYQLHIHRRYQRYKM